MNIGDWRAFTSILDIQIIPWRPYLFANQLIYKLDQYNLSEIVEKKICEDWMNIYIFTNDGKSEQHVHKRIQNCRQAFYSMSFSRMSYPGLPTGIKSQLWETICCPTILYGMEAVSLPKIQFKNIESTQGSLIKQSLGLSKYSHHSKILIAGKLLGASRLSIIAELICGGGFSK